MWKCKAGLFAVVALAISGCILDEAEIEHRNNLLIDPDEQVRAA